MQEVMTKLRFNQPCLGNVRKKDQNEMLKDAEGRVLFLPTWWQAVALFAAKVCNKHQELVKQICWDPVVEGLPKHFRRYYEPGKFTVHEAFLPGDVIRIHAVLPDGLPAADFKEILEVAGRYQGICPYKPERKMGTFEVLEVRPVGRAPVVTSIIEAPDGKL